jgi:hypothetical protein
MAEEEEREGRAWTPCASSSFGGSPWEIGPNKGVISVVFSVSKCWPGGVWLLEIAVRVWCRVAACCEVVVKVLLETRELVGCSLAEG